MCQPTLGYPCGFREVPPRNLEVTGHALHVMYLGVSQRIPTYSGVLGSDPRYPRMPCVLGYLKLPLGSCKYCMKDEEMCSR